jgi:hypothetical protein
MKTKRNLIVLGSLALVAAFSGTALAEQWRIHAASCWTSGSRGGIVSSNWRGIEATGDDSGIIEFQCAVPDQQTELKQNHTTLNIHVYDGTASYESGARACVTFWDGDGGNCGTRAYYSAATTGNLTLSPSRAQWSAANANHFGFVLVDVPAYNSRVKGMFIVN